MTHVAIQDASTRRSGDTAFWTNASLDRIDSSRGYVRGNVQLICFWANCAKNDLNDDVFRRFLATAGRHVLGLPPSE